MIDFVEGGYSDEEQNQTVFVGLMSGDLESRVTHCIAVSVSKDDDVTIHRIISYLNTHLLSKVESKEIFCSIWNKIGQEINMERLSVLLEEELHELTIYDILDGTRSTIKQDSYIPSNLDGGLFAVGLMHYLKALGAKSCVFMVATSYNRDRGEEEYAKIVKKVAQSIPVLKEYCIQNGISCTVLRGGVDEGLVQGPIGFLDPLIDDIEESTKDGEFRAYYLIDYSEEWAFNAGMKEIMKIPNIDIGIRHTKFQPYGGGYIPLKMTNSQFLYCQNGSVFSTWTPVDFLTMIACALMGKVLNRGEGLRKIYFSQQELIERHIKREELLSEKSIKLNCSDMPKKFTFGDSVGEISVRT